MAPAAPRCPDMVCMESATTIEGVELEILAQILSANTPRIGPGLSPPSEANGNCDLSATLKRKGPSPNTKHAHCLVSVHPVIPVATQELAPSMRTFSTPERSCKYLFCRTRQMQRHAPDKAQWRPLRRSSLARAGLPPGGEISDSPRVALSTSLAPG